MTVPARPCCQVVIYVVVVIAMFSTTTAFLNHGPIRSSRRLAIDTRPIVDFLPTKTHKRALTPPTKPIPTLCAEETSNSVAAASTLEKEEKVISNFESWFKSHSESDLYSSIRHIYFGKLRGLTWSANLGISGDIPSTPVISVPLSVVLQSDIAPGSATERGDWDTTLARQLWSECQRGEQSKISGYCSFLMQRGNDDSSDAPAAPTSTAPNALRHWTLAERTTLQRTSVGQKLLNLEKEQQEAWKSKYRESITAASVAGTDTMLMSWEQFQWAMEVVHSRAFRGNFGSNVKSTEGSSTVLSSLLPTIVPFLGAALAGWVYLQNNPFPSDIVMLGLAAVAILPLGFNLLGFSSNPPSAVLLPMIDSANHKEDADSSIEYDPPTKCFQMSIGPQCLTTSAEHPNLQQLCISYGKRSDAELLLNYGFLPGVPCSDDAPLSVQRERLAGVFNQRREAEQG